MVGIPDSAKWFFIAVIFINTLVIPSLAIALLSTLKIVNKLHLDDQRSRIIPIVVVTICYGVCAYMLSGVMLAFLIKKFIYAALGCLLLVFVVNFYWKISLHLTAMGGLIAMLFVLNFSGFANLYLTSIIFILLSGALGSAVLQMGDHNIWQVGVGFIGGFLISILILLLMA